MAPWLSRPSQKQCGQGQMCARASTLFGDGNSDHLPIEVSEDSRPRNLHAAAAATRRAERCAESNSAAASAFHHGNSGRRKKLSL